MKIAAIIAEYNPFHNGHACQIDLLRRDLGFDHVIVVMSPDFVQRGEPALTDMYDRAAAALLGGADAVLSLPVTLATGSAEYFAEGAVSLVSSLGCVDALCFGCETPDLPLLQRTAAVLNEESPAYTAALRKALSSGLSFPAARERALREIRAEKSEERLHALLSAPNNILALEYVRALQRLRSPVAPLPIRRRGSGYHDQELAPGGAGVGYPSAAALRALIGRTGPASAGDPSSGEADLAAAAPSLREALSPFIPPAALSLLLRALKEGRTPSQERYDLLLHYALLDFATAPDPALQDMGSALCSRILAGADQFTTLPAFCNSLHSRDLTHTRVSRALLHLLLRIPQSLPDTLLGRTAQADAAGEGSLLYTQLLGFRRSSAALLAVLKEKSRVPVIARPASGQKLLRGAALESFRKDMHAQAVYALLCRDRQASRDTAPSSRGYRRRPVIIGEDVSS